MTDLDTNQNDCRFWGDHVEGRIIKGYGTAVAISGKGITRIFDIRRRKPDSQAVWPL